MHFGKVDLPLLQGMPAWLNKIPAGYRNQLVNHAMHMATPEPTDTDGLQIYSEPRSAAGPDARSSFSLGSTASMFAKPASLCDAHPRPLSSAASVPHVSSDEVTLAPSALSIHFDPATTMHASSIASVPDKDASEHDAPLSVIEAMEHTMLAATKARTGAKAAHADLKAKVAPKKGGKGKAALAIAAKAAGKVVPTAVGGVIKAAGKAVLKKPACAVMLKRPAGAYPDMTDVFERLRTCPLDGVRRGVFTSRAFDGAKRRCVNGGMDRDDALAFARLQYQRASELFDSRQ